MGVFMEQDWASGWVQDSQKSSQQRKLTRGLGRDYSEMTQNYAIDSLQSRGQAIPPCDCFPFRLSWAQRILDMHVRHSRILERFMLMLLTNVY